MHGTRNPIAYAPGLYAGGADAIAYAPGLYANGAAARSRCITRQFFWMLAM